tara:strand:+ start:717 stop:938 length:222 start_codon:yes stop_codon:yes gene_type:complete
MRQSLIKNLVVIKKFYSNRLSNISNNEIIPIKGEFKEWIDDSFEGNHEIWTLPDLTRSERLENFCRSIKKKLN